MDMKKFEWFVADEIRESLPNEDGWTREFTVYYLVCENPYGRRFTNYSYGQNKTELEGIAAHLNAVGALPTGPNDNEVDPAYGSKAYADQGTEWSRCQREMEEAW